MTVMEIPCIKGHVPPEIHHLGSYKIQAVHWQLSVAAIRLLGAPGKLFHDFCICSVLHNLYSKILYPLLNKLIM